MDTDTDSHLFNLSYSGISNNTLTGYAYLLDFDKNQINSTDTFGISSVGNYKLGETSLMFLVHPTLTKNEINQTCDAIISVMKLIILKI